MQVKVLVFKDLKEPIFVDVALIHKGIYQTDLPAIYRLDVTIDKLVDNWIRFFSGTGDDDVVTNLNKCELKVYELKEVL